MISMERSQYQQERDNRMLNLDFVQGLAKSYFNLPRNQISTSQSTTQSAILLSIVSAIIQPATMCLMATIIYLTVSQLSHPFSVAMYAIQLGLLIFANIVKRILVDRGKRQSDEAINQRTIKVYRGQAELQDIAWGDVRQGDIVYLQQGQTAPADLIVLDSQEIDLRQAITYVDVKNVNGGLISQKKKACYLTQILNRHSNQKLFWPSYRKILSGRLRYEKPTADMNSFTSYLKVSKDPKMEKLTIQNLILRESIVKTSLWVYGLVIYPGMDSKIMKNFKQGHQTRASFFTQTDKLFCFSLAINILLGTVFSITYSFIGQPLQKPFASIAYHFLMFSTALPNLLYLGRDLFMIMFSLSSMQKQIQVRNYENLQQLGGISYSIISNVGVLNTGKLFVNQIVTQSSVYQFKDQQNFDDITQNKKGIRNQMKRRHGSSIKEDQFMSSNNQRNFLTPILNYDKRKSALVFKESQQVKQEQSNFQIDDDANVRFKDISNNHNKVVTKLNTHLQPLKLNKKRFYNDIKRKQKQAIDILKAISLCHRAKLYYSTTKSIYEGVSFVSSEEILLKILKFVGWSMEPQIKNKVELGIYINEERQKINEQTGVLSFEQKKVFYKWCGINSFTHSKKLYSVVVQQNNNATLYCKGSPEDMIEKLKIGKQTQKIIEQTVSTYQDKQSEILIYAKRQFSQQQKYIYQSDYDSLKSSLTTTQQEIDAFSIKYEKDLEFICVIGMSTQIDQKADAVVKQLRMSGIKTCIFAQESSDANNLRKLIMQGNCDWKDVRLQHQSIEQIKYYLNQVTNLLHSNYNLGYLLTVSGKAWNTIRQNSEVTQHFMFVLYYCQGLLAIKFSPQNIAELTHKIRHSYPEEQKIMGIGSTFTDLKFLGQSNISISMSSDLPTDIKASSLQKIIDAIKLGPFFVKTRLATQGLILYKVITISTIILVYEIICNIQRISNTIDGSVVFFYMVISTCIQLCYQIFHFRTPTKLEDTKIYGAFKNDYKKLYLILLEAMVHGIVIIMAVYFTLPNVRITGGKILPIQALDMSIFIILIIVNSGRNFLSEYHTKLSSFIMGVINLAIMCICVVATAFTSVGFHRVASQFSNLFIAYDSITLLINVSVMCLACSLFIQQVLKKNIPNFSQKKSSKPRNTSQKKQQMINLIRHLYKDQSSMQLSIQQIAQKQMNVNRLKIDRFLQIKNHQDNIKFNYHRANKAKTMLLKILIIQLVYYIVILILDVSLLTESFQGYQIALICAIGVTIIGVLVSWRKQMYMCYYRMVILISFFVTSLMLVYAFIKNDTETYIFICFTAVVITQSIAIWFPVLLAIMIVICISSILTSVLMSDNPSERIFQSIFLTVSFIINLWVLYKAEIDAKISFIITETFEKQNNYVNDILSILVPKFIKNHLEQNGFALEQEQKKVSILFCYVCNFDEIVKEEGKNVVNLMDELFRQFDQLCHNFAVQKIQTVGQTYMAATGIKPYEDQIETEMKKKNQVERLLKMAIQMLEKSTAIMWGTKKNKRITIKIGIHHGNVVVGVIGYHKPQFSLIGDTVNTTSRHCSTANPDQIILSQVAYKLLTKFPASAFIKSMKKMKGLGQVAVFRYLNNQVKETNHTRVRLRFQAIVKRVIEQLKQQGVIKPKNYKALELAQQYFQARRASKRMTRNSEMRRSLSHDGIQLDCILQQKEETSKFADLQLKYNSLLELTQKKPQFIKYLLTKNVSQDRITLIVLAAVYLIVYFLDIAKDKYTTITISLTSIGLAIFPVMLFIYRRAIKNKYINILYLVLQSYLMLSIKIRQIIPNQNLSYLQLVYLYSMIQLTVCSSQTAFRFVHTVILCIISIGLSAAILISHGAFDISILIEGFYFCLICIRKYSLLEETYQTYSFSQIHQKKSKEQSDLVSQLLPKHAYEKLKNQNSQNRLQLTDRFQKATMLFADIKGFTSYSNQTTPVGVVKMLRELFEQFDKLCLKWNVYKVYTIGDCYVVLGFTNCYQRDYLQEAKNVVNMGLAMVQTIQKVRESLNFDELDMRIGVHTGTIIGGIIGTEIVRYDIYGPDVMVANKFEQFGKIGAIHISESTKQILDQDKKKCFNIIPYGTVKVQKLNAQYQGFLLSKKKFEV